MFRYKDVVESKKILESIECDSCHKVITPDNFEDWQEILHISFVGGYGSIFGDGTRKEADICQHCVDALLGKILREGKEN